MKSDIINTLLNYVPNGVKPFPEIGDWHTVNTVALDYNEFAFEPMKEAYHNDYKTFKKNRGEGKALGLAFCYGATEYNVQGTFPDMPKATAKQITDNFFKSLPVFNKYLKKLLKQAKKDLYVKTFLGRKLYIPQLSSDEEFRVQMQGKNNAYNYPIQSFGAEHIRLSMYKVGEWVENNQMYKWQGNNIVNHYIKRIVTIHQDDLDSFVEEELDKMEIGNTLVLVIDNDNKVVSEYDRPVRMTSKFLTDNNMNIIF